MITRLPDEIIFDCGRHEVGRKQAITVSIHHKIAGIGVDCYSLGRQQLHGDEQQFEWLYSVCMKL